MSKHKFVDDARGFWTRHRRRSLKFYRQNLKHQLNTLKRLALSESSLNKSRDTKSRDGDLPKQLPDS